MPLNKRIALIGAGNMTEALVTGMLKAGTARAEELYATDIREERRGHFESNYRIKTGLDNRDAASWAEVIILSVEPQILDQVLDEIRPAIGTDALMISVAAGYPLARMAAHLKSDARLVRAMPNTPSSVLAGVTAVSFGMGLSETDRTISKTIFQSVGTVVEVEEHLMDAVTGLSGSGPAYVYVMIEALADGGVKMGLPRSVAELLAAQTVLGAATMLLETGEHPGRLKDRVASPAGTTIAGIHQLEVGRFRATLIAAVEAAATRSQQLGLLDS
jgi:pyrroline-5-carboxylate reductase